MIHAGHKSRPYGLGCHVRACTLFLLPTGISGSLRRSGKYRLWHCYTLQNYVNRLGTWNVRGINYITKREEVVDIFKKGKFDLLALTEMKLKGEGEVSWVEVDGIISGVQEMERAKEWVSILLRNVWHRAVVKHGCISPRILWTKFKG